ncbi:MAG: ATP-binding protein [Thermoplasmatota archaeon]
MALCSGLHVFHSDSGHTRSSRILLGTSILFLILILLFTSHLPSASAQTPITVRVGYYQNKPIIFTNGNGALRGISHDVLSEIALEEGWELQFIEGTRGECLERLQKGEIDLIAGTESPCRDNDFMKSGEEVLVTNWGVIFSSSGMEIDSLMDLNGKWIGVVKDDIYSNGTMGLKNLISSFYIPSVIVEFNNYGEVIDAIEDGDVDCGVLNNLLASSVENERDIERTGIVFNPLDIKYSVLKNSTKGEMILEALDSRLHQMKEDKESVYYSALEEYIRRDTTSPVSEIVPLWILQLILIILGIVVFLFITTMVLRYRVRARTSELTQTNARLDKDIQRRKKLERKLEDEKNRSVFYMDLLLHDIGNIHQGLLSGHYLYDMIKSDKEKAEEIMVRNRELLNRSMTLMKNVRKYSEATTTPYKPEPIELVTTMKKALTSVLLSYQDVEVNYKFNVPKGPAIKVQAEPLIEEVFFNIYHNALKAHGVEKPYIETNVIITTDRKRARIEIVDKGKGIPEVSKKDLFTRMKEAGSAKHTGMGLSLVKALVDRYNGEIYVEDRVKGDHTKGAKFVILLPLYGK